MPDDDVIVLTAPTEGAKVYPTEQFHIATEHEFPPEFIQGHGFWDMKVEGGEFVECDKLTLIREVTMNPFPVDGRDSRQLGVLQATGVSGKYWLRVRILDDHSQIWDTSPALRITVGRGNAREQVDTDRATGSSEGV